MNAGHYIPKGACGNDYYFDERNVHAQCFHCNCVLEGNRIKYREFILTKYGKDALEELETRYGTTNRDYPFEEKIAYYKQKDHEQGFV